MIDRRLPKRRGDEIDPAQFDPPQEWGIIDVVHDFEEPKATYFDVEDYIGLQNAKELAQKHIDRINDRRARVNFLIDIIETVFPRAKPITKHLRYDMSKKDLKERVSVALESTREGYAWLFTLLVVIGGYFGYSFSEADLMSVYELAGGVVVGALAFYYAAKDIFKRED